jgi:hypothetical protein
VWESRSKNHQESEKVAEIFARRSREKIATRYNIERAEEKEYKKGMADSPEDETIRAQFEAQYGDGAVEDEKE